MLRTAQAPFEGRWVAARLRSAGNAGDAYFSGKSTILTRGFQQARQLPQGIALAGSWTVVSTRRSFLVGPDGAYRQAIVERRRAVHEVGGISNAQIRGNCAAHF